MNFKDKYKEEVNGICFSEHFEKNTANLLKDAAQRKENIMTNKRKPLKIAVLAFAAILILSFSAFAAYTLLTSYEVADHFGEKELASLFEESGFENQTVKGEEYTVTFMGMAPGKELYVIDGIETNVNRSYAVWAVYRNDGIPLSHLDDSPLQFIPVIKGYKVSALFSLGMSASRFSRDGVLYYLYDYTDLEVFADREVSLVAFEGSFPSSNILTADENGNFVYAEGYEGFRGEFELNLDKSKADPKAAEELLNNR